MEFATGCGFTAGWLVGGGGLGGAWDGGLGGGGLETGLGGRDQLFPTMDLGGADGVDVLGARWPALYFPGWTTLTVGVKVLAREGGG